MLNNTKDITCISNNKLEQAQQELQQALTVAYQSPWSNNLQVVLLNRAVVNL